MRQASESPRDEIRRRSREFGLHAVGFARAGQIEPEFRRYLAFVDAGMHGEMRYLAEDRDARARTDGPEVLDGARTVIVGVLSYHRADEVDARGRQRRGPEGTFIARYARGRDYHGFYRDAVRRLAKWMRTRWPGERARPVVDTAPILERAWAQRAGVGFVGKNGCIIVPGLGSYVLLGEVVTTLEIEPDEPMASRCGECEACLHACPTSAFAAPYVLDARRCVSYLTIELRGAIPSDLRAPIGDRLFGCDDCQQVCPYNRTDPPDETTTRRFAVDERWQTTTLHDLATLSPDSFASLTAGTPLSRPQRDGLVRNAAIVMGNSRDRRHLPVLQRVAATDASAMVRDAASWALSRIERE